MMRFDDAGLPKRARVILAYLDLRKFRHIETSFDAAGIYELLSRMHETICAATRRAGGVHVRFIADNTLVLFEPDRPNEVLAALENARASVNEIFEELGMPCRLHVLVHSDQANLGLLGCENRKALDVSGEALNGLGLAMMQVETSGNSDMVNGMVLTEAFHRLLPEDSRLRCAPVETKEVTFFVSNPRGSGSRREGP